MVMVDSTSVVSGGSLGLSSESFGKTLQAGSSEGFRVRFSS